MQNPFKEENPFANQETFSETDKGSYVPPVSGAASTEQINLDVNPFLDPTQSHIAPAPAGPSKSSTNSFGSTTSTSADIFAPPPLPISQQTGAYGPSNPREDALNRKERELEHKEQELRKREAELAKRFPESNKNWPSCYPIFYHDIDADIPVESQNMVRQVYYTWLGLFVCLSYNALCVTLALFSIGAKVVTGWLMSIIYLVLGVPLSLYLWYFRCYRAAKTDRAFTYLVFFCMYFVHICFCVYASLGFYPQWAFAGIANFGEAFDQNKFSGGIYVIGFCLWAIEAIVSLSCLRFSMKAFRTSGKADELPKNKNDLMAQAAVEAMA